MGIFRAAFILSEVKFPSLLFYRFSGTYRSMPTLSKIGGQTRHEEGLIRFRQELDKKQYSVHSYLDIRAVFNLNYVISTHSKGKL